MVTYQFTKSMLVVCIHQKLSSFFDSVQRPCKVLNRTALVVCKSHELLHLTSVLWDWPGGNPLSFGRVYCNLVLRHNVTWIACLLAAEMALGWL